MIRTVASLLALVGLGRGVARLRRAARGLPTAMGAPAADLRVAAHASPHGRNGRFTNTEPVSPLRPLAVAGVLMHRGGSGRPPRPIPLVSDPGPAVAAPLAVTWYGHSSVLIEIDGYRVLTDPMWGERASPSPTIGPRRLHPPPVALSELPDVDAVLISHDHYDHLDLPTVRAVTTSMSAPFVVPPGIGAHLRFWGVPAERIVELDWGGQVGIGDLVVHATPARHFSGRGLVRNSTQWASWALTGPAHRVFFGGDTGYTSAFREIGAELGPFDLTVLPIGAYADAWPDVHMTPEQAVQAHLDLAGRALLPVHWATFDLGMHTWAEPVERLTRAAAPAGIPLAVPRPGARVDLALLTAPEQWWAEPGAGIT
ncbi:MBL fold metallo-hydrolase [Pseudonocardia sp. CA-107938]|uniref:MBL fold metallo-hydrolase n=1 Tax=Pseudonocardia sp. CA-107938 TaxID=3240021 RepID=UPI003D89EE5D